MKQALSTKNTVCVCGGGGQEVWWRCSLNALRVFVGTFVNRPMCRYNVAMIILCVCYAANTTSV